MPWNSLSPDGTKSVKTNKATMQENTTYTETTLNRDHFWNIGTNRDGRHRYVNMLTQAADVSPGAGMGGVIYLKSDGLTPSSVQGFYRNSNGIYEFIPAFLTDTHEVTGSFTDMVSVPDNTYGEIFMFRDGGGKNGGQAGFFKAQSGVCQAWAYGIRIQGDSDAVYNIRFGNGNDVSGLNIRVIADEAVAGNEWNYRVTYRAI